MATLTRATCHQKLCNSKQLLVKTKEEKKSQSKATGLKFKKLNNKVIGSPHLVFGSLFGTSLNHHFNLTPEATHNHQHALPCPILWIETSYAKMGFISGKYLH